jgi:hypothetical protein
MSKTFLRWGLVAAVAVFWSVRPAPLAHALLDTPDAEAAVAVGAPSDLPTVTWGQLRALDIRTGDAGALRRLHGRKVRVPGFIVPLDDFQEEMAEFLLVPYYGACVHTPPPPANQMIFARTTGKRVRVGWWQPVWLEGTLLITPYRSVYGEAGFRMTVDRVLPYEEE